MVEINSEKEKEEKKTKSSKVYYLSCNSLFRLGVTSKKSARKVRKHTSLLLPFSPLIFVALCSFFPCSLTVSMGIDNKNCGVENEKALELDNRIIK